MLVTFVCEWIFVVSLVVMAIALTVMVRDVKRQAKWEQRNNVRCVNWPISDAGKYREK